MVSGIGAVSVSLVIQESGVGVVGRNGCDQCDWFVCRCGQQVGVVSGVGVISVCGFKVGMVSKWAWSVSGCGHWNWCDQ